MILKISDILKVTNDGEPEQRKIVDTNDAPVFTDHEKLEERVNNFNDRPGYEHLIDGIECPICKNKGIVAKIITNGYGEEIQIEQCKCHKRRVLAKLAIDSGLGGYLRKEINDFKCNDTWQSNLRKKAADFCSKEGSTNTWFIACGQSGCGKTLLCSIIANHLLNKYEREVLYITWTDFISKLKRDMMGNETNEVSQYLDKIKNVDVLFIDELLKTYNDTDLKYIIEIINYRYNNNLKTLITSEKLITELLDIDEATFSRVVEKCGSYILNVPKDPAKNYRRRNLERQINKYD